MAQIAFIYMSIVSVFFFLGGVKLVLVLTFLGNNYILTYITCGNLKIKKSSYFFLKKKKEKKKKEEE